MLKRQGVVLFFSPKVVYLHRCHGEEKRLKVKVDLTNSDYGNIKMEEGNCIQETSHRLSFSVKFENYSYDETQKIFTITGHSPKMGDFMVQFLIDENL